ncbi:isopeptide-forming domain-containing fimbrial protein [Deinococcus cellulosilyticus]|uniref:DUF11 domain-containing protein n=1 Tax=Deinococcus cellulosilyticus (strain DSM 18568 / NBRC 106333 / KACC 11606 / 5516J-15) TaxID=1223518 RepID=A0A511N985_DEIC1|nr:isopeptide-forming domain-containing fimbrial protein [Deinococcus cellulosilyticus]GEM49409.1 hypothetical protein DC3_50440 [Deinococcus cellulosilyticus NBRC 106333 = KACC 11606]
MNKRLLSAVSLLTLGSAFAITPAGSTLTNQALVEGGGETTLSNAVNTIITALCRPALTPDGDLAKPAQVFEVLPGSKVVVPLTLKNTGNENSSFALSWTQFNPSWTPENVKFYLDANGNGQLDSADLEQNSHDVKMNDAVRLLMTFTVPVKASGDTFLDPTASCADGAKDDNNVFQLKLNAQSSMTLTKTMTPALVKAGEKVTVNLMVRNTGNTYLKNLQILDNLKQTSLEGFSFVAGSLKSLNSNPEVKEMDGQVSGTLSELAPMEQVSLEFQLLVDDLALAGSHENLATATADSLSGAQLKVEARAHTEIEAQYGVALGPVNDPEVPEGSEGDRQTQEITLPDAEMCFEHTLLNTSNSEDDYTLTAEVPEGWNAVFLNVYRLPLAQPVHLKAREAVNYWVCYEKSSAVASGNVDFQLTATSAHGPVNKTWDTVKLSLLPGEAVVLTKSIKDARGSAPVFGPYLAGEAFTYVLEYNNTTGVDLHNVIVQDTLVSGLEFVRASVPPSSTTALPENQTGLSWDIGDLKQGKNSILVTVKLNQDLADGAVLRNTFSLTSDEIKNRLSNEVNVGVWSSGILFAKAALQDQVMIGDQLGWKLTATNKSVNGTLSQVKIVDDLPQGLTYVAGSSKVNGVAFRDPTVEGQKITWTGLPDMKVGAVLTVTFNTRVNPGVAEKIQNTAEFTAMGMSSTQATVVAMHSTAVATAKVVGAMAHPIATLVGRVYLDSNDNGTFEPEVDKPIEKARVILAGGRMVLTDKQGRYSFDGLEAGVWAVRLDPNSVTYAPRATPQDGGQRGTQSSMIYGLSTLDFPLIAAQARTETLRSTRLNFGPVTVHKSVSRNAEGRYTVTLNVSAKDTLEDFLLDDPLPQNAQLVSGKNTLSDAILAAGEHQVQYEFVLTKVGESAVTDPEVSWNVK